MDYPKVFKCIYRKARKEHRCYECNKIIEYGERYQNIRGLWDHRWYEYKTCTTCDDLRDELKYDGELAPFGDLQEWVQEADMEFIRVGDRDE